MDKKNTTIGVLLVAAAFAFLWFGPKPASVPKTPAEVRETVAQQQATAAANGTAPAAAPALTSGANAMFVAAMAADDTTAPELANDYIKVRFSAAGGAVRDVALVTKEGGRTKYPAELHGEAPFIFNEHHAEPMLALVDFPGLDHGTRYQLVNQTANSVTYRATLDNRLEVTRTYTLSPNTGTDSDPYVIHHTTTIHNLGTQTAAPSKIAVALGTAAPINAADPAMLLTTGYSTGKDQKFIRRGELEQAYGLLGMGSHDARATIESAGPIAWACVTNQFFASIYTPGEAGSSMVTRRVKLLRELPDNLPNAYGVAATATFDVKAIAPNASTTLTGNLYVGPKEYRRLAKTDVFKQDEDKVMQYGTYLGWASKLLISLMTGIHSLLPNVPWAWGLSIVLTTLTLKLIFLYPTVTASRSMRRMAKVQPQMTALREKYKDNPAKMQTAMMELYKEHKINPLGGCIPMLLPLPFFIGFFSMLQSTAELRFAPFLWAHDLSAPDVVYSFGTYTLPILGVTHFTLNILPILLTATTFFQMRMTPTPNMDPAQAKMMQFMPLAFLVFYYNFWCALSIYSTTNALFTVGQQYFINRAKDDGDPANVTVAPGGKVTKNVTPKKQK